MKEDIVGFFNEFHTTTTLPKAITASFLALIPKRNHPQGLKEFKPICLIGCIYKILDNVLADRLKKVLHNVISLSFDFSPRSTDSGWGSSSQ